MILVDLYIFITIDSRSRRGHDHMIVGFTTTYAISVYSN